MGSWYAVLQGETFTSLADEYGFSDHRVLYHHPQNRELRSKRPDPDILFPGDSVFIPEKNTEGVPAATDRRHVFILSSARKVLRIRLQDFNGKPFASTKYDLRLGASVLSGTTDENGLFEEHVPVQADKAILTIAEHQWTLRIGDLNPVDKTPDRGVSGIQQRLRNLGFDPGPIDGIFGPLTKAAVLAFQSKHPPLIANGVCTPDTVNRLLEEHCS